MSRCQTPQRLCDRSATALQQPLGAAQPPGGDVRRRAGLGDRGLRGREARERHAERRARDVVEAEAWQKATERGSPPCSPQMPIFRSGFAARPRSTAIRISSPTPSLVEHLERVVLHHAVLEVAREELALGVVARDAERRLRQVVRAEGEELARSRRSRRRGCTRAAARSSCRPSARARRLLGPDALGQLGEPAELLGEADERVHDLDERRVAGALLHRVRGARRSRGSASRRSPGTSARAGSRACRASGSSRAARGCGRACARRSPAPPAGGTRAAAGRAAGSSPAGPPSPRRCPRSRTAGTAAAGRAPRGGSPSFSARIISWTTGSRSSPKNMCSVRQRPMPSAPNSRARAASAGLSAFARTFSRRSSSAQPRIVWKSSFSCGGTSGIAPTNTCAGAAVDRDHVALAQLVAAELRDRRRRAGAPRSRRRTACPSRARRPPRARSCRRGR